MGARAFFAPQKPAPWVGRGGACQGLREGAENQPVKVDESKEILQVNTCRCVWELNNCLHVSSTKQTDAEG